MEPLEAPESQALVSMLAAGSGVAAKDSALADVVPALELVRFGDNPHVLCGIEPV
jgi:hypothetical protein